MGLFCILNVWHHPINFIYFYMLVTYEFIFQFLLCFPWTWDIFTSVYCTRQEHARLWKFGRDSLSRGCGLVWSLQRGTQRETNNSPQGSGWSHLTVSETVPIMTPVRMSHCPRARQVLWGPLTYWPTDLLTYWLHLLITSPNSAPNWGPRVQIPQHKGDISHSNHHHTFSSI